MSLLTDKYDNARTYKVIITAAAAPANPMMDVHKYSLLHPSTTTTTTTTSR
jgi:hypothetical protein